MEFQVKKHRVPAGPKLFHHARSGSGKQFQSYLEPAANALQPLGHFGCCCGARHVESNNQPLARLFLFIRRRSAGGNESWIQPFRDRHICIVKQGAAQRRCTFTLFAGLNGVWPGDTIEEGGN